MRGFSCLFMELLTEDCPITRYPSTHSLKTLLEEMSLENKEGMRKYSEFGEIGCIPFCKNLKMGLTLLCFSKQIPG